MLLEGSKDFFRYVINRNSRRKTWLMGYFSTVEAILTTANMEQQAKDNAVEAFLAYVFDRAREIFESDGAPVFMCKDFGTPFYRIVETSL